jgi:hypothetical protein
MVLAFPLFPLVVPEGLIYGTGVDLLAMERNLSLSMQSWICVFRIFPVVTPRTIPTTSAFRLSQSKYCGSLMQRATPNVSLDSNAPVRVPKMSNDCRISVNELPIG